jgi:hypothetical protein
VVRSTTALLILLNQLVNARHLLAVSPTLNYQPKTPARRIRVRERWLREAEVEKGGQRGEISAQMADPPKFGHGEACPVSGIHPGAQDPIGFGVIVVR